MSKQYPISNYDNYRPSRNPYHKFISDWSKESSKPLIFIDHDTEKNRGKWREFFGVSPQTPLELELGSYHGETLNALAKQSPERVFLGVEWKFKQCFKAAKKAENQGVNNLCFLRANIARLPLMVAPGEVDRAMVFFPDPWSKSSHQKWRLLQPDFFRVMAWLLKPGAELFLKTDHPEYAEFIAASIKEAGFFAPMEEAQAQAVWTRIPPTPFEKIFLRQGLPIYPSAFVRDKAPAKLPELVARSLNLN